MTACSTTEAGPQLRGLSHELHFASLHNPGRGLAVPCDAQGHVLLDRLSSAPQQPTPASQADDTREERP